MPAGRKSLELEICASQSQNLHMAAKCMRLQLYALFVLCQVAQVFAQPLQLIHVLDAALEGKRPDTGTTLTNKNKFWATVRSQKPGIVPKS